MKFNKEFSKPAYISFLRCAAISALVLPAVSFILAVIANASADPTSAIGISTLVSIVVSAAISGAVCIRICKDDGLKICTLCALFITLIMMLIGLISNKGAIPISAVMNYICYITVYVFVSVVSRRREGASRRRHRRR